MARPGTVDKNQISIRLTIKEEAAERVDLERVRN